MDRAAFRAAHAGRLAALYAQSGGAAWHVGEETFAEALFESVRRRFGDAAGAPRDVDHYLAALHVRDLALACGCAAGDDAAWDLFVREYRPVLYAAARGIRGDARDLADGLYAELFGVTERGGARRSLFAYYHGRSRLSTWLRSVVAQRCVDRHRAGVRCESLDAEIGGAESLPSMTASPDPGRLRYIQDAQSALDAAIDRLDGRDRLMLQLYYGQALTLAEIGRITREHEATVSRKLERTRQSLRREVALELRRTHGLGDRALEECFAVAAESPELHLGRLLTRVDDV